MPVAPASQVGCPPLTPRRGPADELAAHWVTCHGRHVAKIAEALGAEPADKREAAREALRQKAGAGGGHREVVPALLHHALTETGTKELVFDLLQAVSRDDCAYAVSKLQVFVKDRYDHMQTAAKGAVLYLAKGFVEKRAKGWDSLCHVLLRLIKGGSPTSENVWLASSMVDIVQSHFAAVAKNLALLHAALFTFLRVLVDLHGVDEGGRFAAMRALEKHATALCAKVLREHSKDCVPMGRDLVRLLVSKELLESPELFRVWAELQGSEEVTRALRTPSPQWVLQSRVPPEMETHLRFLMTQVRMGNQKRYQEWFRQRHLATPASLSLVPDLIRYVCVVYHPSNQILQSDVLPRWALIGWLLQLVGGTPRERPCLLALLMDYLFFGRKDSIMNTEPAMLLMVHSIPRYAAMTNSILQHLFGFVAGFGEARQGLARECVAAAFQKLAGVGVVKSMDVLLGSEHVAADVKATLGGLLTAARADDADKGKEAAEEAAPGEEERRGEEPEPRGTKRRPPALDPIAESPAASPARAASADSLASSKEASAFFGEAPAGPAGEGGGPGDAAVKVLVKALKQQREDQAPRAKLAATLRDLLRELEALLTASEGLAGGGAALDEVLGAMKAPGWPRADGEYGHLFPDAVASVAMLPPDSLHGLLVSACSKSRKAWKLLSLMRHSDAGRSIGAHVLMHACASAIKAQEDNSDVSCLDEAINAFQCYEHYVNECARYFDESAEACCAKDCLELCRSSVFILAKCALPLLTFLPNYTVANPSFLYLVLSILEPSLKLTLGCAVAVRSASFAVLVPADASEAPACAERLAACVKASLDWDAQCQGAFWGFFAAEVRALDGDVADDLLLAALGALPVADRLHVCLEALHGVAAALRERPPTSRLFKALMGLPAPLESFKNGVLAGWIHRPAPGPEAAVKPSDLEFVLNAGTSGSQIVSNLFQEAQDLLLKKRGG